MAQKNNNNWLLYLLSIPGFIFAIWQTFKITKEYFFAKKVESLFSKNENGTRKQRNLYKDTLRKNILRAAKRIEEEEGSFKKDESIKAYNKEENVEKEEIVSYKNEK